MVYQLGSYRYWEAYLRRNDFEYGQFGENLTVDGLAHDEVCIGDRYRIGGAIFEVTQPRVRGENQRENYISQRECVSKHHPHG